MGRLPFRPDNPPARTIPASGTNPGAASALTVTQLAGRIDAAVRRGIPLPVEVIGEVSGFRDRTHWYLNLKDAESVVSGVVFQSAARRAGFTPVNGQQVVARGRIEFYAKSGRISLIIDSLRPGGAGALDLAYRALCDELRGLGWFATERKRPLPSFPRRVAVITSESGAALQDVLVTMKRRCPAVGVLVVDTLVQGESAAREIAGRIWQVSREAKSLSVDVVLVTRGGGTKEDLWAFNERVVAEAIVNCSVPVVAAIGHETDTTIAELVADERCATPTQAAVRLTPDGAALIRQVDSLGARALSMVTRRIRYDRQQIAGLARHPLFMNPREVVARSAERLFAVHERLSAAACGRVLKVARRIEQMGLRLERHRPGAVHSRTLARLTAADARLHAGVRHRLTAVPVDAMWARIARAAPLNLRVQRARLESLERQLIAVGPMRVLERGFSCTIRDDGRLVRSPHDVRDGDVVETRVAEGSFRSVVGDAPSVVPVASLIPAVAGSPATPITSPHVAKRSTPKAGRGELEGPGLFAP